MPFADGQLLHQRYRVRCKINQGGFGTIYLALDTAGQRDVVIKESNSTDNGEQNALLEEIKVLTRVQHPHLPQIYDFFQSSEGRLCIVMEYIPGEDLWSRYQAGHPLPILTVVNWGIDILEALTVLHGQSPSIVHRDVKLGNIQIHAENDHAYLLDLGVAKSDGHTRIFAVTEPFSPPEQYQHGRTTPASDVYAVGIVLYMLVSHREPPDGTHRNTELLIAPRELNPEIPIALEQIILKAIEPDPDNRYPDAPTMLADLQDLGLFALATERRSMEAQISALNARIGELSRTSEAQEDVLMSLRQRVHDLEGELAAAHEQQSTLAKHYAERDVLIESLEEELQRLERRSAERDAQIEQLRSQTAAVQPVISTAGLRRAHEESTMLARLWSNNRFWEVGLLVVFLGTIIFAVMPAKDASRNVQLLTIAIGFYPLLFLSIASALRILRTGIEFCGSRLLMHALVGLFFGVFISILAQGIITIILWKSSPVTFGAFDIATIITIMSSGGILTGIITSLTE